MIIDRRVLITDSVFSYERHDTGETFYWNTDLLNRIRLQKPEWFRRITLDILPEIYELTLKHRGIEEPHMERLTPERMEEPGLGIFFDDNDVFALVDGNHRLVKRYRAGLRTMDAWVTVRSVWRLAQVNPARGLKEDIDAERREQPVPAPGVVASGATIHE